METNEYDIMESWVASPLDRAVDSAIARENASYLAIPERERRDAATETWCWQQATAILWALNPAAAQDRRDAYIAAVRDAAAKPGAWDFLGLDA